jgi:hypothetical protein
MPWLSTRAAATIFILFGGFCRPHPIQAQIIAERMEQLSGSQARWTNAEGMTGRGGDANLVASISDTIPFPADSDSAHANPKKKSPTGAMLRSLLVPGWGQFYNGKYFKAALVLGAETGLIATAIYWNQKASHANNQIDRRFYQRNRNTANWWLAGTILLSMLDAYIDAYLSDFDESPDLSIVLMEHPAIASSGVLLKLKIAF